MMNAVDTRQEYEVAQAVQAVFSPWLNEWSDFSFTYFCRELAHASGEFDLKEMKPADRSAVYQLYPPIDIESGTVPTNRMQIAEDETGQPVIDPQSGQPQMKEVGPWQWNNIRNRFPELYDWAVADFSRLTLHALQKQEREPSPLDKIATMGWAVVK